LPIGHFRATSIAERGFFVNALWAEIGKIWLKNHQEKIKKA
jgi:hypothetical protein